MIAGSTTPLRVLCVDDNRDAAESLAIILDMVGFETAVCFSGRSALETAATFQPHACVSDINMPGMNGYDLARGLRATSYGGALYLLAITAQATEDHRRKSMEAGFNDHLTKPADPLEIIRLLEHLTPSDSVRT